MITGSNSRKRAAEPVSDVVRAQPERDRDCEGAGDSEECLVKRRRVECVTMDQVCINITAVRGTSFCIDSHIPLQVCVIADAYHNSGYDS